MIDTMLPRFALISGSAARITFIVPNSVTPMTLLASSGEVSAKVLITQVAALLTKIETVPARR